jgi:hypothetical protein
MDWRRSILTLPALTMLLVSCPQDQVGAPIALSVCDAIDKGSEFVGKDVSIRGWVFASRHSTMLGDSVCPSKARNQFLFADKRAEIHQINLANPSDQLSQQVKQDIQEFPVWPEWYFRGVFHGTLIARTPPDLPHGSDPEVSLVPFTLVIDRIDEFRVERPPWLAPPIPRETE